jgi:hypothetical protein
MQLLSPDEMPDLLQGTVCRQSRMGVLLLALLMGVMLLGIPGFLLCQAPLPWWIKAIGAGFGGFVMHWLVGYVRKSWRSSNWLLRITPGGLWINLRSYLNPDLPSSRTIVHLQLGEINQACEHVWKRAETSSDGTTTWTDRYLDIQLRDSVSAELRAEIAEERRRHVSRSHLGGIVKSRSRHGHVAVTIVGDHTIRLAWRGRFDWVSPSLRHVLRELAGRITIRATTHSVLSTMEPLTSEEIDSLTLRLVESGDKMGAVKLLTDRRGYGLTEAHQFVDELTAAL